MPFQSEEKLFKVLLRSGAQPLPPPPPLLLFSLQLLFGLVLGEEHWVLAYGAHFYKKTVLMPRKLSFLLYFLYYSTATASSVGCASQTDC